MGAYLYPGYYGNAANGKRPLIRIGDQPPLRLDNRYGQELETCRMTQISSGPSVLQYPQKFKKWPKNPHAFLQKMR